MISVLHSFELTQKWPFDLFFNTTYPFGYKKKGLRIKPETPTPKIGLLPWHGDSTLHILSDFCQICLVFHQTLAYACSNPK